MSRELLTVFDQLYRSKVGAKYPINGGKDGKLLKDLRAIYSDEDITRYMRAFFEMDDDFFEQAGFSLGCFRSCLPKVIAWVNRKGSVAVQWNKLPASVRSDLRRIHAERPAPDNCPHNPPCDEAMICQMKVSAEKRQRGEVA